MSIELAVGKILFLVLMALAGLLVHRLLRVDITLGALLAGAAFGVVVPLSGFDTGIRAHNLKEIVFYIILPVLIFQAAWHIRLDALKRMLVPVLLLAIPGVLISGLITAALVYYGIDHPTGFPWLAALLTGAILAATDPVSVVAKLQSLHAPRELETLIEGESLFNDAAAVVLFGIVLSFAMGEHSTGGASLLLEFMLVFFGGALVGGLIGAAAAGLARALGSPAATSIVTVFAAFAAFYVAEHLLHVSGILSIMFAAILTRVLLRRETFLSSATHTWEWLGLLFNALLFALMGLVITFEMFADQWLAILIAIGASLIARVPAVMASAGMSTLLGRPLPGAYQGVLVWGGLRGAIAIALVLSLPVELDYWWTVQSMVFGVVLFTLLVQGPTTGWLLRRLGLVS